GWSEPLALAPVPENVRRVLAEVWTLEARGEHAAVAAFSKTSLELIALGAPPDLVARAHRAAIQEVEHARLCFAVASAYGGVVVEPAALPEALAGDTPDLFRLARESLLDGCLREGLASEIASLGAERARDPEIARVLRVQAKEEAQHAAFSWAIVEWAISCGGEPMRRSLSSAVGEMEFPRCDDLPDHGRIGRAAVEPRFHAIRSGARERLSVMT
ncbi:MAG: ferritin-like domain-containing protein, partial [Myxococcales bacterium]